MLHADYRRLLHLEPGQMRPPAIQRIYRHLGRQHPLPIQPMSKEIDVSFNQFFGRHTPFNKDDIIRFSTLEQTWPIECLPTHINDGGSLRLYIWRNERPTPTQHYEQSVIRLPLLEQVPEARSFFTTYARAQYELYEGNRTNKCPLCASQLLGYPMWDHPVENCPFSQLPDEAKIEFISINSISYCPDCNSRSATHHREQCEPKPCANCSHFGHTSALSLCDHQLGEDTDQAHQELQEYANRCRYNSLARLQQMLLRDRNHHLLYRSHIDSPYTYLRDRRRQDDNLEYCGLGIYEDVGGEFVFVPIQSYGNHAIGRRADYRSMVPPEFFSQAAVSYIPRFQPAVVEYMQTIGELVTQYRVNPESIRQMVLPHLPLEQRVQRPMSRAEPASSSNSQQGTPANCGNCNAQQHSLPPCSARQNQSQTPSRPSTSATTSATNRGPLSLRQQMELDLEIAVAVQEGLTCPNGPHSRSKPPVQASQQPSTSASSAMQSSSTVTETPQKKSSAEKTDPLTTTSSPSTASLSSDGAEISEEINFENELMKEQERQEMELEKTLCEQAKIWCREPLRVYDGQKIKAARPSFQLKAFNRLLQTDFPDGTGATIIRIQTLLYILTGQEDIRSGIFDNRSNMQLRDYAHQLVAIGKILREEKVLLTTLEAESLVIVCRKTSGGTEFINIPSIDLFCKNKSLVQRSLRRLGEINNINIRYIDYFPSPNGRKYFTEDIYAMNQMTEHQQTVFESFCQQQNDLARPPHGAFAPAALQKLLEQPYSTVPALVKIRLEWLTRLLTGQLDDNDYDQGINNEIMNYAFMYKAMIRVLFIIRSTPSTVVKVNRFDCFEELATSAARGHELVLPTFRLFNAHGWSRWQVWLERCWDQLVNQLKEEHACRCPSINMLGN